VDVLRILFRDAAIEESDEDKPGVILDYDTDGNIVGLEVLNASQRVENPRGINYAVAPVIRQKRRSSKTAESAKRNSD
jgi:uncharacterized protein YuzE